MTDPISLDRSTGEVRGPAGACRLAPQPARLLECLLDAAGELVTREALVEAIWPGERYGVQDRLTYCVHQLRDALTSVGLPALVETLPRRGYRIAAQGAAAIASAPTPFRIRRRVGLGALAATLLVIVVLELIPRPASTASPAERHAALHAAKHQALNAQR